MSGKARPSLRAKTLYNVSHYSGLSQTDKDCIEEVFQKCGEYEDTGLTPSDVRSLWGGWDAMMLILTDINGYDRLRELVKADKDGRVIVTDAPPAADVVPVVRCKDCRFLKFSDFYGECGCGLLGIVSPWDYCSHGEGKDGDDPCGQG